MKKLISLFAILLCISFSVFAQNSSIPEFISEQGYSFVQFNKENFQNQIIGRDAIGVTLNFYTWNTKAKTWDFLKSLELNNEKEKLGEYSSLFGKSKAAVIEVTNHDFEIVINNTTYSWSPNSTPLCFLVSMTKEATEREKTKQREEAIFARAYEIFNAYKITDAELKAQAKGYVYHGISESDENEKLLEARALSKGHAYVSTLKLSTDLNYIEFTEFSLVTGTLYVSGRLPVKYAADSLRGKLVLREQNLANEVWYCYTPNSTGGVTIIGFGISEKTYELGFDIILRELEASGKIKTSKTKKFYAEWLKENN